MSLTRKEADDLIKVVNSFVGSEVQEVRVEKVEEGEPVEQESKPELTEEETKKLFRGQVPETFDFSEASFVRAGSTGDKVWLKFKETKRWVPDLETLEKIGYGLDDVEEVKDEELRALKEEFSLYPARLW